LINKEVFKYILTIPKGKSESVDQRRTDSFQILARTLNMFAPLLHLCCASYFTRSLVLFVYFVDRCLSLCPFFRHCVVCPSLIYRFWFPLWPYISLQRTVIFGVDMKTLRSMRILLLTSYPKTKQKIRTNVMVKQNKQKHDLQHKTGSPEGSEYRGQFYCELKSIHCPWFEKDTYLDYVCSVL
jgi:hypothetical protein